MTRSGLSLKEIVVSHNNDYSDSEKLFLRGSNGLNLTNIKTGQISKTFTPKQTVSVIVPSYNPHRFDLFVHALAKQRATTLKKTELIVINDNTKNSSLYLNHLSGINSVGSIKLVNNAKNNGSSVGRNIGLSLAEGEVVVFTDDDMVWDKGALERLIYKFSHLTTNVMFLGFRSNVFQNDITGYTPSLAKDWRYKVKVNNTYLQVSIYNTPIPRRSTFRLLAETDAFKQFGFGAVVGYWDLPCMVIGHSIAVSKAIAVSSGGFPQEGFDGWGLEDIMFGARVIATGTKVVPSLDWVSTHIRHRPRQGSVRKSLLKNYKEYFRQLDMQPPKFRPLKTMKVKKIKNLTVYDYK